MDTFWIFYKLAQIFGCFPFKRVIHANIQIVDSIHFVIQIILLVLTNGCLFGNCFTIVLMLSNQLHSNSLNFKKFFRQLNETPTDDFAFWASLMGLNILYWTIQIKVSFFYKIKFSLVISHTFEFSRQKPRHQIA